MLGRRKQRISRALRLGCRAPTKGLGNVAPNVNGASPASGVDGLPDDMSGASASAVSKGAGYRGETAADSRSCNRPPSTTFPALWCSLAIISYTTVGQAPTRTLRPQRTHVLLHGDTKAKGLRRLLFEASPFDILAGVAWPLDDIHRWVIAGLVGPRGL